MTDNIGGFVSQRSWGAIRNGRFVTVSRLASGQYLVTLSMAGTWESLGEAYVDEPPRNVLDAFRCVAQAQLSREVFP